MIAPFGITTDASFRPGMLNDTTTKVFRLGSWPYKEGAALVIGFSNSSGSLRALITGVDHIPIKDLTLADALAGGYSNLAALTSRFRFYSDINGDISENDVVTMITFKRT